MVDVMHPIDLLVSLAALPAVVLLVLPVFRWRWQARQRSLDRAASAKPEVALSIRSFEASRQHLLGACTDCGACVKHCAFLTAHGTPRALLLGLDSTSPRSGEIAFECSLCGLCAAVCPQRIDPCHLFLGMRRRQVERGQLHYRRYHRQLLHEQWGASSLLSWYGLPAECTTVFYPGCALPGSRPATTLRMFADLRRTLPTLGIVLDCCMKPSHDLGRAAAFHASFEAMRRLLVARGVHTVVTACPNCTVMFRQYAPEWTVRLAYGLLGAGQLGAAAPPGTEVSVHDPCPLRGDVHSHRTTRNLLTAMGYTVVDMPHRGRFALCCGEGGSVRAVRPEFAKHWTRLRQQETGGRPLITSCAGCAQLLGRSTPTVHLADLLYQPDPLRSRRPMLAGAPLGYWNRLMLKRRVQGMIQVQELRRRPTTK